MFIHNLIAEQHRHPLESSLKKHRSVLDEKTLRDLYLCARAKALNQSPPDSAPVNFAVNGFPVDEDTRVGVATDPATGMYVQLAATKQNPSGMQLTCGQKWVAEGKDQTGQMGMAMW